jgi:hypothetical protein
MSPAHASSDALEGFPDVAAALAAVLPRVPPPARLKERLDARLRDFAREREASFALRRASSGETVLCAKL